MTRAVTTIGTVLALVACGSEPRGTMTPDAARAGDAPTQGTAIPSWQLEDVQPMSPRVGQTYGLDTFGGRIVVVTLVEGF